MIIDKIKYWIDKRKNPGNYLFEREQKLARELAKTMTNAVKPGYIDEQQFEWLKYSLACSYGNNNNLNILTDDESQIFAYDVASFTYRKAALIKYILKMATIKEFRVYFKMSVIADSRPHCSTTWYVDEFQHLIDALGAGEIDFAKKYAQVNMRCVGLDFQLPGVRGSLWYALHMTFRSLALNKTDTIHEWLPTLKVEMNRVHPCYQLLPIIIESLIARDNTSFENELLSFVKEHDKIFLNNKFGETAQGNVVVDLDDKYLFVWALAFLNLARYNGMDVSIDHHLVPKELLIAVSN